MTILFRSTDVRIGMAAVTALTLVAASLASPCVAAGLGGGHAGTRGVGVSAGVSAGSSGLSGGISAVGGGLGVGAGVAASAQGASISGSIASPSSGAVRGVAAVSAGAGVTAGEGAAGGNGLGISASGSGSTQGATVGGSVSTSQGGLGVAGSTTASGVAAGTGMTAGTAGPSPSGASTTGAGVQASTTESNGNSGSQSPAFGGSTIAPRSGADDAGGETATARVPGLDEQRIPLDTYSRATRSAADDDPIHCSSRFCLRFHRYLSDLDVGETPMADASSPAAELYRSFDEVIEAARAGDPDAEFEIGRVLSSRGLGVKPDLARAAAWFGRAARHGNRTATLALAQLAMRPSHR